MPIFAALFVSSYVLTVATVADAVPIFDVEKTCQGTEIAAVFAGQNLETCVQIEEAARDQLKKEWGEFSAAKRDCVATVKIGGPPSYAELVTCLRDLKRNVEKLRATSPETIEDGGAGGSRSRRR